MRKLAKMSLMSATAIMDCENGQIVEEGGDLNLVCHGGGGKGAAPAAAPQQQIIQPTPPVQEASVEIEADEFEDDAKKKRAAGKGSLKLPLTPTEDTGLKV